MPKLSSPPITEELKRFSELPNEAYVRAPTVRALFACGKTTMWGAVGKYIPEPRRFGPGNVAFNVGELRKALAK